MSAPERVRVRDSRGAWHNATAVSGVEGTHRDGVRIHDFPVVWVELDGHVGRIPWPASAVEAMDLDDLPPYSLADDPADRRMRDVHGATQEPEGPRRSPPRQRSGP